MHEMARYLSLFPGEKKTVSVHSRSYNVSSSK